MSCSDFCTAAKCAELEARIGALEQALELLEAAFESHTQQEIPQAHGYTPAVVVNTTISGNNVLTTQVSVDSESDYSEVELPRFEPFVTFDIFPIGDNSYHFQVAVNGDSDSDVLNLSDLSNHNTSNLKIDGSYQGDYLTLTVADGESFDTAEILIPIPELEPHVKSNLRINGSYQGDYLTLTVADGESFDTAEILIPLSELEQIYEPHIKSNLKIDGIYQDDYLTLTVADGESFDTAQILIDTNMNCDELERKIDDCCDLIVNHITDNRNIVVAELEETENNLKNEIDAAESIINNNLRDITDKIEIINEKAEIIESAVTIDISGQINSGYKCAFPLDENGKIETTYAESSYDENRGSYEGKGLAGLHQILVAISHNLDAIYKESCAAVDPIMEITLEDMYNFCDDSGIKREDYSDDEEGQKRYNRDLNLYFYELQKDSKYGHLINDPNDPEITGSITPSGDLTLIQAPTNWTNYILTDFALIQSRINKNAICNLDLESEPIDVVSIVASEKDLHRVKSKVLILHFVLLDVYPKRSASDNYWQLQIPAAKDSYDWFVDFENLRRTHGNQYAELQFNENYVPVSGWFEDEAAAETFFDAVLSLTNATEKNRIFPKHKTPQMNISSAVTRPYRAFIKSVNDQGRPVCHAKYVPVINESSFTN